ncbi:uncharacterized protein BJ171DRAFT_515212 [Polychytrium aggregatum]|uniref:uncharacterized protein n=1 Tax=Polychytrium aggregatum TaxID=110093 RepID=UPI0022FF2FC8|nr:uncharacterized protein BJ171DRAFT_515212 [Polychytrium aggregatum]KAI9202215.1 hypothetical protein BJ171DRAFT_515212 [Polychytrium aggregatum]
MSPQEPSPLELPSLDLFGQDMPILGPTTSVVHESLWALPDVVLLRILMFLEMPSNFTASCRRIRYLSRSASVKGRWLLLHPRQMAEWIGATCSPKAAGFFNAKILMFLFRYSQRFMPSYQSTSFLKPIDVSGAYPSITPISIVNCIWKTAVFKKYLHVIKAIVESSYLQIITFETLNQTFTDAIRADNSTILTFLLSKPTVFAAFTNDNWRAHLLCAIEHNKPRMFQILRDHGLPLGAGWTGSARQAIVSQSWGIVKLLAPSLPDFETVEQWSSGASSAATAGRRDVVELLFRHINPAWPRETIEATWSTCVDNAVQMSQIGVLTFLVEHSLGALNRYRIQPSSLSQAMEHHNIKAMERLLLNRELHSEQLQTFIHSESLLRLCKEFSLGRAKIPQQLRLEMARILIQVGGVDLGTATGGMAVLEAMAVADIEMADFLMQRGASVHVLSALQVHTTFVRIMHEPDLSIERLATCMSRILEICPQFSEALGLHDNEILEKAVADGHMAVVKVCVRHGCDVAALKPSTLTQAIESWNHTLAEYLIECGATMTWKDCIQLETICRRLGTLEPANPTPFNKTDVSSSGANPTPDQGASLDSGADATSASGPSLADSAVSMSRENSLDRLASPAERSCKRVEFLKERLRAMTGLELVEAVTTCAESGFVEILEVLLAEGDVESALVSPDVKQALAALVVSLCQFSVYRVSERHGKFSSSRSMQNHMDIIHSLLQHSAGLSDDQTMSAVLGALDLGFAINLFEWLIQTRSKATASTGDRAGDDMNRLICQFLISQIKESVCQHAVTELAPTLETRTPGDAAKTSDSEVKPVIVVRVSTHRPHIEQLKAIANRFPEALFWNKYELLLNAVKASDEEIVDCICKHPNFDVNHPAVAEALVLARDHNKFDTFFQLSNAGCKPPSWSDTAKMNELRIARERSFESLGSNNNNIGLSPGSRSSRNLRHALGRNLSPSGSRSSSPGGIPMSRRRYGGSASSHGSSRNLSRSSSHSSLNKDEAERIPSIAGAGSEDLCQPNASEAPSLDPTFVASTFSGFTFRAEQVTL